MPMPALGPVGTRVYDEVKPLAYDDAATDYTLAHFIKAWCASMEILEEVVRDTDAGPGWSIIMDPDLAPALFLDFLSQMTGSRPVLGETEAQKRARIKGMTGLRRGSPQAIYAAAARLLTGNKTVIFNERAGGNAWALEIYTLAEETPEPKTPTAWGDPTNLFTNPSFETNTNGVTNAGHGIVAGPTAAYRDPGGKKSGDFALNQQFDTAGQGLVFNISGNFVAGEEVTVSWWQGGSGATRTMDAYLHDGVNASAAYSYVSPVSVAAASVHFTATFTVPANTTTLKFVVKQTQAGNNYQTFDAMIAVRGEVAVDYFDGSFTDYSWSGTAHNSTSLSPTEFDAPEVLAEILAQKPAGIKLTYKAIQGVTWQTIIAQYFTWDATMDANATWGNVLADEL